MDKNDIKLYLSGGASNYNPNASLGGTISATELIDDDLHNLFDKVNPAESADGDTEYRCFYIKNTHASLTLTSAQIFIDTNTPSPDTLIQISVATEIGSPVQTIAGESMAPVGQVFSSAPNEGASLSLGDLTPGSVKAVWVKRSVTPGAAPFNDSAILKIFGQIIS